VGNIQRVELTVRDKMIHCAGCEQRVESVLRKLPGVFSVKADHKTQGVHLGVDIDQLSIQALREKLAVIGYETEG